MRTIHLLKFLFISLILLIGCGYNTNRNIKESLIEENTSYFNENTSNSDFLKYNIKVDRCVKSVLADNMDTYIINEKSNLNDMYIEVYHKTEKFGSLVRVYWEKSKNDKTDFIIYDTKDIITEEGLEKNYFSNSPYMMRFTIIDIREIGTYYSMLFEYDAQRDKYMQCYLLYSD